MTLTIDLTPTEQERVTAAARRTGLDPAEFIKKLVTESLSASIGNKQQNEIAATEPGIDRNHFYFTATREEFNSALDEIAEMNKNAPVLPDAAFERESLYEDREL